MPDDGDLAQARETCTQLGPRKPEPSQRRGPARRQQQIHRLQPIVQGSTVLSVFEVESHHLLPDAQDLVVAGAHPGQRVPARRLDLDDRRPISHSLHAAAEPGRFTASVSTRTPRSGRCAASRSAPAAFIRTRRGPLYWAAGRSFPGYRGRTTSRTGQQRLLHAKHAPGRRFQEDYYAPLRQQYLPDAACSRTQKTPPQSIALQIPAPPIPANLLSRLTILALPTILVEGSRRAGRRHGRERSQDGPNDRLDAELCCFGAPQ